MKFLKFAVVCLWALGVAACAANEPSDEEPIMVSEKDPIIEIEAKKNEKLFNQTEKEMAESMKLPDITYKFDSIRPPEYSYEFLDKLYVFVPNKQQIITINFDSVNLSLSSLQIQQLH